MIEKTVNRLRSKRNEKAHKLLTLERLMFDESETIAHKLIKTLREEIIQIDKLIEDSKRNRK